MVVIKEIESWYIAGLRDIESKKFGIQTFSTTDSLTKENFSNLIPKRYDSRLDFMIEILKNFSAETAKQKNKSFRYCIEKCNCEVSRNDSSIR
jgi:hypothetical protein